MSSISPKMRAKTGYMNPRIIEPKRPRVMSHHSLELALITRSKDTSGMTPSSSSF